MGRPLMHRLRSVSDKLFPKRRRKQIEDWDFIMVFDLSARSTIQKYFKDLECQKHVKFQFIQHKQDGRFLVLIAMDEHIVINEAHQIKILKIKNKRSFQLNLKQLYALIEKAESQNSNHYADYLRYICARHQPQNKLISEQQRYSVFNKYKISKYQKCQDGSLFSPEQQLRCKYNFLLTYRQSIPHQNAIQDSFRFPFVDIMKHDNCHQIVPIHKNSRYSPIILDSVKDYIGSNDETYFQFVSFMQRWLVFPAVIGLITTFFNYFFEYSADDSPGDFVYSLLIMFWSIYFITSWESQSRWLKVKQNSGYNDEVWSSHQNILQKRGLSRRISNISGKWQLYLPFKQKLQYYFISIGTCVLISILSIIFMILSLNARGFVDPDHKLLYFETISSWAAKGGIFDAQTWWGQIPNLIHVIVTNAFDQSVYRPLAKKLTKIQRHLNSKTHSNSIIMKFFIYEFIITFADFFYIAFVRFDIEGLREQLLSLFFIDIIRRLVAETVIPRLKNKYMSYSLKSSINQKITQEKQLRHYAILQVNKESFESFDDYLQIITNFGYLAMISSCFPLAPLLIIIAHSVQILQDKYKLIHIFRRRLPQKFVGMGYWKDIIVFICYMSIVTNILLFAFSSQQIVSIFPQIFQSGKDLVLGNTDFSTLLGGAATGMLSAMMTIGNSTLETVADTFDGFDAQTSTNNLGNQTNYMINDGWGDYGIDQGSDLNKFWIDPVQKCQNNSGAFPFNVQSFTPVPKQHQVEFIGILFLIQHVFLIGFILLRNFISKQKGTVDIFLERREYKRRIKKYLSKDVLAQSLRDQVVGKLIGQINQDNPLGYLEKLISGTASQISTNDSGFKQQKPQVDGQTDNFFGRILQKIAGNDEQTITQKTVIQQKAFSNYENNFSSNKND